MPRRLNTRPYSARPGSAYSQKSSRTTLTGKNLAKTRPKRMIYDKESLYDVNIHLKSDINRVMDENVRLRTFIRNLETERDKLEQQNPSKTRAAFISLKRLYQDTKSALDAKEGEVHDLKHTLKSTAINELQVELQVLTEECKRLRRILDEAALAHTVEPGADGSPQVVNMEKFYELQAQMKEMQVEYNSMAQQNDALKEEVAFWKSKAVSSKSREAEVFELKKQISELQADQKDQTQRNSRLQREVNTFRASTAIVQATEVITDIPQAFLDLASEFSLRKFCKSIGLHGTNTLTQIEFIDGLQSYGISDKAGVEQLFETIALGEETVDFARVKDFYFGRVEMKPMFRHLSLLLQVKRYEIDQIPPLMFGTALDKNYKSSDLEIILTSAPIELNRDISKQIVDHLFAKKSTRSGTKLCQSLLSELKSWTVLTEADEQKFDNELIAIFASHKAEFYRRCSEIDTTSDKFITTEQLHQIFSDLQIACSSEMSKYLEILFYTDEQQLDRVPYEGFLKAYS